MTHPFAYQKPTTAQTAQIEAVRASCRDLHNLILSLPPGRERSLAVTKLEEVSMWANKGIVFADPENAENWVNIADDEWLEPSPQYKRIK